MNIRPLLAFTFIGILWGAGSSQGQAKEWNKEPVAVLQQGAEAGDAQAQFVLATVYLKGKEVEQNFSKGSEWLTKHGGPCEISNGLALCAIHHKAFDKGSIGLDESMRVQVSPAVNGSGMVGRLFWDFDGKSIALPMMRENYPKEGFVEWHRKEVFRG